MIRKSISTLLSAREAAALLEVSTATLYAYVSRGMLRSEPAGGGRRERRYRREDLERLLARKAARRDPAAAAGATLEWGMPVIESAITSIDGGRLFYRGHDALALAAERRFEEVAALLVVGELPAGGGLRGGTASVAAPVADPALLSRRDLSGLERAQALLPLAGAADLRAWDLRPAALLHTALALPPLVAAAVAGVPPHPDGAAATLAAGWGVPSEHLAALDAALVLCADHELNVSAFTARCVASAGGNLYDAVAAALAALKGHRHGGVAARVEAMLGESERHARRAGAAAPEARRRDGGDAAASATRAGRGDGTPEVGRLAAARGAVEARLRRGEAVPGFGHPLYPEGDPRARALFARARREAGTAGTAERLAPVEALAAAAGELLGEAPSLDLGLVALARALALPADAPIGLFATGRTAGWAAHAVEEHARGRLIRPRARYVGPPPRA